MSEKLDKQQEITQLKGVIPAERTEKGDLKKAIEELREFLKRFPFLKEEVANRRAKQFNQQPDYFDNRNELSS
jgi:hypothetical protein